MKSDKKKKVVVSAGIVVGVVLAIAFVRLIPTGHRQHNLPHDDSSPQSPGPQPRQAEPARSTAKERLDADVVRAKDLKIQQAANTPIDFFGKVVDEQGAPVEGATVHYIVGSLSFNGTGVEEARPSDANGNFTITGRRGPDLSVRVEHPDFYKTVQSEQRFQYASILRSREVDATPLPSSSSPAIFLLRKKGIAEGLVHSRVELRLPMSGESVSVSLSTGRIGNTSDAIRLSLQSKAKTLPLNEFHPFDWNLAIQAPNGGLTSRADTLDFTAPANGYEPEIRVDMPAVLGQPQWKSRSDRQYFVQLPSGRYGRFRLNIAADSGACLIESYLNPTAGSRNLEFDPKKQIKP
ncbi:MAG TPA: carboxypeptidase-like regulatory domain-containing protein [Chthoniobacterales bacterium]